MWVDSLSQQNTTDEMDDNHTAQEIETVSLLEWCCFDIPEIFNK